MAVPRANTTASKLEDLWGKAVRSLTERDRRFIDFSQDDKRDSLEKLLGIVEREQEVDVNRQLEIPRKNGKPIVLRDVFGKIANCIHKFREVGDNVAQYDPAHAALPWAAVRLILQAVVSEHEIRTSMLDGLEHVADLIARFAWVETLYLHASTIKRVNLQNALVRLYAAILTYLVKARRYYAKHTHERILKSLVQTEEQSVQNYLRTIADEEDKVNKIARLIDAQRLSEIYKTMNGGFTSLIGRSKEISEQLQHLQLSVDMQPREPAISRDDLLKWINAVSTNDDYHVALQARVKNTCEWALHTPEFETWLAPDPLSKAAKVLWWHGRPGSGKSILAASLVEYLKKHTSAPVCSFFCFYNHEDKRRCNNIVGSWVSQLVRSSEIAFQVAKEVYKKKDSPIAAQSELWRIFQEASLQLQECFFIVDGFDECVREDASARSFSPLDSRALFLKQLDDAISNTQARVLIVSREDVDIRERLRLSLGHNATGSNWNVWTEYEVTPGDTAKDIERFSRDILEQKLSTSRATAELKQELAADAADKSEGMFLWIKLLYGRLSRSNNPSRLRSIISSTPGGLDQAYERDLRTILSSAEEDQIRAISILRWILFAERPLAVRELCEALIVERDLRDEDQEFDTEIFKSDDGFLDQADIPEVWDDRDVEDLILRFCGSLVVVQGEELTDQPIESRTVNFVHFSVKEYLLKTDHFISASQAHTHIALNCLRYLCYDDFYQERNSTLEEFDSKLKKYAFVRYASIFGSNHLEYSAPVSPALVQWCNHLFDPKAFKWLSLSEVLCSSEFESYEDYFTEHLDSYHSPLYLASEFGPMETIHFLVENGEDVNHTGGYYGCPLSAAAARGYQEAIKTLLASGANPNQSGGKYCNPLQSAAANGHESIVTTLLASGASANQTGGYWHAPIIAASQFDDDPEVSKAIICRLLEAGGDIRVKSRDGTTALHEAANAGSTKIIECLIENGADVNAQTDDGRTPLFIACYNNNETAIRALIDKGADVNAVTETGWSPLHTLAQYGNDAVVNLLLDHSADINAKTTTDYTALHDAAREGHVSTIELLVLHGADVDAKIEDGSTSLLLAARYGHDKALACLLSIGASISSKDNRGYTALHFAAKGGYEEIIKILISHGSDVKAVSRDRWTPLHLAAVHGHGEVVKILIEHGSDVNAVTVDATTALHIAAYYGNEDAVKLLLANDSDVNAVGPRRDTVLHSAAAGGNEKIVDLLLSKGLDIEAVKEDGETALHIAVRSQKLAAVECLLHHNANVQAKTANEDTALHIAVENGQEKIIELLLSKDIDIEAVNKNGNSALHLAARDEEPAAQDQKLALVECLLQHGANIQAKTTFENTALHYAVGKGNKQIVELLISKGIDIEAVNENGDTALHIAVCNDNKQIVELLISKDVDIEAVNQYGDTPLHAAVYCQKLASVNILLQHGANPTAKSLDGKTPLDLARENDENEDEDDEDDDDDGDGNENEDEDGDEDGDEGDDEGGNEGDDDGDSDDDDDDEDEDEDEDENENGENDKEDKIKRKEERREVKQKIISLLESWEKPEQQTAT